MKVFVLLAVVIGVGVLGGSIVRSRRRQANDGQVSPRWVVEHAYEKDGDRP
jgi:hypothetical protein